MVNRNDSNTSINTVINDLSNDTENLNIGKYNFPFAIRVTYEYGTGTFLQNNSYFSMNMKHYQESGGQTTFQDIGLSIWGDRVNYQFQRSDYAQQIATEFLCPDTFDIELLGDNLASTYKFVELDIFKWANGTGIVWESQDQINNATNSVVVEIIIINSFFDLEDYNNPIKSYIQDGLEFYTINGNRNNVRLYFQENESERQDDYFALFPQSKEEKFLRLANFDQRLSYGESDILRVSFLKSNQKQTIERSVFAILDLLGLLGGVLEVFSIFAGIFVAIFADRLLNYSILSNLYQVDTTKWQQDYRNEFNDINQVELNSSSNLNRHEEYKSGEFDENPETLNNRASQPTTAINAQTKLHKDRLIDKAKTNMKNRRLYNYKASDWCYNLLCWCKLKCF